MEVAKRYLDVVTVTAYGETWQVRKGTKFLAVDKNGTVKSFNKKPKLLGDQWFSSGKSGFSFSCIAKVKGFKDWKNSATEI
jgi:hypothetical protein